MTDQVRACQVGKGQVKLVQVNSCLDWSSPVKTGQVNLDQLKVSFGPKIFSDPKSFGPKIFGLNTFMNQKSFFHPK